MVCLRLIAVLIGLNLVFAVRAGINSGEDFKISSDYAAAEQNTPRVAVGLDGKFAVVWSDFRNGNGDIYAQLFDSAAIPVGYNLMINDDDRGAWQLDPDLSADWYGNYYVVWKDYRNNSYPFDPDIFYQKLDSLESIGLNKNITTEPPDSSHQSPSVAASGWGKTVTAWTDLRNRNWDVFVQTLDVDGNPIGSSARVNDDLAAAPQHEPEVALSADGWFVIVWYDGRNGNDDIYIQKFDSSGVPVGGNIKVNDDNGDSRQKFPSAAIGGNDVIYIVWTDWRNGAYPDNPEIYGQRLGLDLNRLGSNFKINRDGSYAAQRNPRVATDRMGNACVVWSDSTGGDWNITGQMIDLNGQLRDDNFPVNLDSAGIQHFPDVALDGYYLYLVWADNRDGNFDIYGRIHRYNQPALQTDPARLTFSRDINDPDPAPAPIVLRNAGYGELDYRLEAENDWIKIINPSGTTPDSVYIGVNGDSLGCGTYNGYIRLVNITHGDSTGLLPVQFTITGPLLDPTPDSLSFRALMEIGPPPAQQIIVNNSGTGDLNWSLTTTAAWLVPDRIQGLSGDTVTVNCDLTALTVGTYEGYLLFFDSEALNSPESLLVTLDLLSNLAYLTAEPASINLDIIWGRSITDSLQIINLGNRTSDWTAQNGAAWLALLNSAGSDNDFVRFSISTAALNAGLLADSIIIYDSAAFNNRIVVPIAANVYISDTIFIPPVQARLGDILQVPLYLRTENEIDNGILQLLFDSSMMTYGSFLEPVGDLADRVSLVVDTLLSQITIEIMSDSVLGPIGRGEHHIGDLSMTANDSVDGITAFTIDPAGSFYLETADSFIFSPILECHDLEIMLPTDADNPGLETNTAVFSLGQNYPNPFNSQTGINFDLPVSGWTRLEIFNILGQQITLLADEYLYSGPHEVTWDGRDENGNEVASGIYFYRLISRNHSAVRKMAYLK